MPGSLANAANGFAIVGFIDVVVRMGREASHFLRTIEDAPQEVRDLENNFQGISTLLSETREYVLRHEAGLPGSSVNQLMPLLTSSLSAVHNELLPLVTDLRQYPCTDLLTASRATFKWAREKGNVSRLTRSIESHKLTLVTALTLMRGY